MAGQVSYPKFSDFRHVTATELITRKSDVLQAIFPINAYEGPKISALVIVSSIGGYTLLLGDALSFVDLRNSCDSLREILPVVFDCSPRSCSAEFQQAIRDQGSAVAGSPPLIDLQIDVDSRNSIYKFLYPSYSGPDPQGELIQLITGQANEICIAGYRIRRIANTWQPPAARPHWQGLAFEQSDRVIRTWLHEANPNALQSARDEVQSEITITQEKIGGKTAEIQRQSAVGRYVGELKTRLDQDLAGINDVLLEQQNKLAFLNAQTVNSAAKTTLQCAITLQIDSEEKIRLLERYVCQKIVTIIDRALDQVTWEALQIGTVAIESFIKQKMKALEQKIPRLAELSSGSSMDWDVDEDSRPTLSGKKPKTLTDWEDFRDEAMPDNAPWIKQSFQDFCLEKVGHQVPTALERPDLEKRWKLDLSKKLQWVTAKLRLADQDLIIKEDHSFTDLDITIFDAHKEQMVKVLRKENQLSYGLSLELEEQYKERLLLIEAARDHRWVHLVKRITTDGNIYFGVTRPPNSQNDRPDPNSDLNEVHIPVLNIQNPLRARAARIRPAPIDSSNRIYKMICKGSCCGLRLWGSNSLHKK